MKKYLYLILPVSLFLAFTIFTIIFKTCDLQYMSDTNTFLGLYHFNSEVNDWVAFKNQYLAMRIFSDIILIVTMLFPVGFGVAFIVEWIKRKSFVLVDRQLFIMLGASITVVLFYLVFEIMKINYSPDSVADNLHASYPSTHVFVGAMFLTTGITTSYDYLKVNSKGLKAAIYIFDIFLIGLLAFTRLLSGKHWCSDVVASVILVLFLLSVFYFIRHLFIVEKEKVEE